MGRTRSALEANLVNCGANSVICGANFNGANVPINSKLQHPPPRAYPGHLTVRRARGGGNLNVALEGWGI